MTELQMQAKCFEWFHNAYPLERGMLHNNDNNSFNRIEGNRKKALGVIPGVSDFEFIGMDSIYFIELKLPGGLCSEDQIKFANMVRARNHTYIIVYSFEQFQMTMKLIIGY